LPNIIKIDPYNFELYRIKVGSFFVTQCITFHLSKNYMFIRKKHFANNKL